MSGYTRAEAFAAVKVVLKRMGTIRAAARAFATTRKVVRKALRRFRASAPAGLADLSRRPQHSPHKSSDALEALVVQARRRHGYGPLRLQRDAHLPLPPGTIRNILRRHRVRAKRRRTYKGTRRGARNCRPSRRQPRQAARRPPGERSVLGP